MDAPVVTNARFATESELLRNMSTRNSWCSRAHILLYTVLRRQSRKPALAFLFNQWHNKKSRTGGGRCLNQKSLDRLSKNRRLQQGDFS